MILEKKVDINTITDYYNHFEKRTPIILINEKQFDTPVNFKQAKTKAIHRWFTYKEGFSPIFVSDFIKRFKTSPNPVIFDPFGGIGTTILESSFLGYNAYSNDINPLSNYISNIKNTQYNIEDLEDLKNSLAEFNNSKLIKKAVPPQNETVVNYFEKETLGFILQVQNWIENLQAIKTLNLFNLALLTNLEKISTHRKDGNGVKRKKNFESINSIIEIKEKISLKINEFIDDITKSNNISKSKVYYQSSFDKYELEEKADIVITSPPYANCFDYSKVYLVELWFGNFFKEKKDQKNFRENSVISHVHYKWNPRHSSYGHDLVENEIKQYLANCKLWDRKIPQMLVGYFSDMGKVLFELIPNLNKGATIGVVVGNSVYAGLPIATDILVSEIAVKLGYELIGIESYRTLTPSSQQLKIIRNKDKKFLRESLIILKWK
jgi:hypothetical protein